MKQTKPINEFLYVLLALAFVLLVEDFTFNALVWGLENINAESATLAINAPIFEGATVVTGTAPPGESVTLQVIQDPTQGQVTQAGDDGGFRFNLSAPLNQGYVVQVTSGGAVDYALVESPAARWYFPMVVR